MSDNLHFYISLRALNELKDRMEAPHHESIMSIYEDEHYGDRTRSLDRIDDQIDYAHTVIDEVIAMAKSTGQLLEDM